MITFPPKPSIPSNDFFYTLYRANPPNQSKEDTIYKLANSISRGRPWHALRAQVFSMCQIVDPGLREGVYRVFSRRPNLVMDLQTDAVLGLQDADSIDVSPPYDVSTFLRTYHV
jgi:hypothetical protein